MKKLNMHTLTKKIFGAMAITLSALLFVSTSSALTSANGVSYSSAGRGGATAYSSAQAQSSGFGGLGFGSLGSYVPYVINGFRGYGNNCANPCTTSFCNNSCGYGGYDVCDNAYINVYGNDCDNGCSNPNSLLRLNSYMPRISNIFSYCI